MAHKNTITFGLLSMYSFELDHLLSIIHKASSLPYPSPFSLPFSKAASPKSMQIPSL